MAMKVVTGMARAHCEVGVLSTHCKEMMACDKIIGQAACRLLSSLSSSDTARVKKKTVCWSRGKEAPLGNLASRLVP